MTTIGVISDTHVPLRARLLPPAALRLLSRADMIFHAGDLVSFEVLRQLEALAPVYAVAGNMDPAEIKLELPRKRTMKVGPFLFGISHGDRFNPFSAAAVLRHIGPVDCLVCGHSHRAVIGRAGDMVVFNPGSTVGGDESSVGLISVYEESFRPRIFRLDEVEAGSDGLEG